MIHVMDHGIAGKNLEELQEQNHELYQEFCPKIMKILMEILHMHRKCWENTEKYLPFFITELHGTIAYAFEKKAWDLNGCT